MEWYNEQLRLPMQPSDATVHMVGKYEDAKVSLFIELNFMSTFCEIMLDEKIINDEQIEPETIRNKMLNKIYRHKNISFINLIHKSSIDEEIKRTMISKALSEVKNVKN